MIKILISLLFTSMLFSQTYSSIEDIMKDKEESLSTYTPLSIESLGLKIIDLDGDGDLDVILNFHCSEPKCLYVYLNINGVYKKVIDEFGWIKAFDVTNSPNYKTSRMILNSEAHLCCGESPFLSFRKFKFENDKVILSKNYLKYAYKNYSEAINHRMIEPSKFIDDPYYVKTRNDNYNVRFSASLEPVTATFTCPENTNIIAKLKKNSVVKVIAEREESDDRTWLYVEIPNSAIRATEECETPIKGYLFKDQKLRGWISNKYTDKTTANFSSY